MTGYRAKVYVAALAKNGEQAQLDMVTEEIGELLVAIAHHRRGRVPVDAVAEEIADVLVMLEQLERIFGIVPGTVHEIVDAKIARLAGRVGVRKPCECQHPIEIEGTGTCMACGGVL